MRLARFEWMLDVREAPACVPLRQLRGYRSDERRKAHGCSSPPLLPVPLVVCLRQRRPLVCLLNTTAVERNRRVGTIGDPRTVFRFETSTTCTAVEYRTYVKNAQAPLSSGDPVPAGVPGVHSADPPPPRDAIRRDHGEDALGDGEGEGRGGRPAKKPRRAAASRDPPLEPAALEPRRFEYPMDATDGGVGGCISGAAARRRGRASRRAFAGKLARYARGNFRNTSETPHSVIASTDLWPAKVKHIEFTLAASALGFHIHAF